ncbi:TPA: BglG family transcription antiterminator [Klebsiella aerogenes]|uniref:Putative transcriptional regulator/PTS system, IIA component n=1 Tax=Klebsiella aerogenes (strain ATCC 13048 / DSM 30053 / CCUG 1429 / JCM 1235 / KCTC 2190 / NBRC 13534 / NCIMB 10102 / NCTC 10006 / CDC 819-56) TaxID=1028307 RepID=A0A0H3FN65_KLEAK|nr:PRD domain-containing protein [Klebsiella aerogenes]AEG96849.1 putative transcriptional regulator/PTS system, IIA component [Klebsiella aerogenes KCTC 2190]KLF41675.1 transcription antiterminator BglG [Klebsiella aerogenes]MEC4758874.1 PRD domain-containing protein [Klebsiella aerogenes]QEU20261.1 BglG family transcription antiterminator [Klebsiella aerogenes]QXB10572.1 BglG family transcription antiterminator [Klebsiella aerogenes]
MRFPNQRLAQLFTLLRNETLPQDELAQRLSVSTRTVRADITALNALLAQYGAQFTLNRGSGYQLKIDDRSRFQALEETAPKTQHVPRTAQERIHFLLVRFLTSAFSIKLEDLADEWFVSRATLQNDMVEVRERFQRYQLTLETRPRHGMKLFGSEVSIRACLTDLLWELTLQGGMNPLISAEALEADVPAQLEPVLQETLTRHHIRLTDVGERFICLYGAVVVRRVSEGYPLADFSAEDVAQNVRDAARDLAGELQRLAGKPFSPAEEEWLCVHIAARQVQDVDPETISADDDEALVNYILRYINSQYNYNLLDDAQLHADLLTHIKTMITRVRYQIMIPNPLLDNIKQHYPMAWDMTLAAVSSWGKYTPYTISENEIGFLVLHIGVGLERHYNIGYQRQPHVLLVCDTSNAMVRMIEAILQRKYPQLAIAATIFQREYEQREAIDEDFVISTVRIGEKDKPVVTIAPFPTDYQLDQIGKLVLVDRTRPWMLNKYFDAAHFRVIDKPIDQQTLFAELCQQLQQEGFVDAEFHDSVVEREAIVSTMLGDGIALPHALGLLAKKTVVYTVIAPQGIAWGDETAHIIFLLAISKSEYEEAMAIYDIFVTFLRERAMSRLAATRSFDEFKTVAMECVSRF